MVKPSVLSVGIGIGVLMLGGSGVAIPTLYSVATRAENDRDEVQASLQAERVALVASEEARQANAELLAALKKQRESDQESLATAHEAKRLLTSQLAETQARNRELAADSDTLRMRDEEVAELVEQVEQLRSDNASLLAQRDLVVTGADSSQSKTKTAAARGLVPVPRNAVPRNAVPRNAARSDALTSNKGPLRVPTTSTANSQTTAKPEAAIPTVAAAVRFDDGGWTSAPIISVINPAYGFPMTGHSVSNPAFLPAISVPPNSAYQISPWAAQNW